MTWRKRVHAAITEPSVMEMMKATATRASVAPRLKASASERASSTMASTTAWGSGSRRAPATCEPAHQAASDPAIARVRDQGHLFWDGILGDDPIAVIEQRDAEA